MPRVDFMYVAAKEKNIDDKMLLPTRVLVEDVFQAEKIIKTEDKIEYKEVDYALVKFNSANQYYDIMFLTGPLKNEVYRKNLLLPGIVSDNIEGYIISDFRLQYKTQNLNNELNKFIITQDDVEYLKVVDLISVAETISKKNLEEAKKKAKQNKLKDEIEAELGSY